jgi:hypothetical protein
MEEFKNTIKAYLDKRAQDQMAASAADMVIRQQLQTIPMKL